MIYIVLFLAAVLAVVAYNMYQENQYRKKVRDQFGHSDKDALLNSKTSHVRDGKPSGGPVMMPKPQPAVKKTAKPQDPAMRNLQEQDAVYIAKQKQAKASPFKTEIETVLEESGIIDNSAHTVSEPQTGHSAPKPADAPAKPVPVPQTPAKPLITLKELSKVELPWFDVRFDFISYIALTEVKELHALPRLSNRCRYQIVGCTMDDHFQIAEPIPGIRYQAFIVGIQAVSRNGLASQEELSAFNRQVDAFAQSMGGQTLHTDLAAFIEVASALDAFCARVDQTIAIHLVSPTSISGVELRSAVTGVGFVLEDDGAFHYTDTSGSTMFSICSLNNEPFTNALLDNQSYKGFSMLLDIPHSPAGEKTFDDLFMDLAVRLSGQLNLNLVNDKMEEVSTQWLKDVRTYVLARQSEMLKVGIEPGGKTALRLFS
ncbi:TPA: cell division protein ZipA [Neisseria meningitidis]|uniref:cell division protein ZipA C-terminal FtsZ-binding domain-containing protein n=1 Tax=Neisseria meningitidis TaxID=487 RepID=UPI000FCB0FF4|nr:cell division protein ZipA C-terminal FtsZ-binding domain-containing protein [Neisseria meningitidis]MCL4978496.1 cell division protein ZipA [Neisseria meningitidis]MCL4998955.1 cell division protein ZipA [Neisseria meningitidis]MCL5764151.1 cell division protein ZipA [Neisseria meningitidis]MCL5865019.1 cell division protein ZipA [Neisseria meningitidis]MCL5915608.1 cell division protein ZipA [Neisseria meningitidis]